ncbi:hypothetical protein J6590_089022 [Homalodisca vitripennis]|nr:hypothetical protein J6590_089022 [Homalodisca vitripennis]
MGRFTYRQLLDCCAPVQPDRSGRGKQKPKYNLGKGKRYEYYGLKKMVTDYVGKTSDLVTLQPRTQKKRGLFDAGGHVLKFLFGTVIDSDLEVMNKIKDAINLAVQRMNQLHQAVEDLAANMMTSNLLPPHQFLEVLKSVKQDVNDTLKVLQALHDQFGTLSVKEYSLESTFQHLRVNSFKHRIVKQVILSGSTITVLLIVVFICLRYRVRVANLLRASLRGSRRHPEATRTDAELRDLGKSIVPDEQTVRESNQPERECVPGGSGIIA